MNNKVKIKAIHDIDLEKTLDNLGLLKKINNNKIKCKFCDNIISIQNIYALFPESGDIKIICANPACIRQLLNLIREDKINI